MDTVNEVIGRLFLFAVVIITVATVVMLKFAERHPTDAKRLQIKVGKGIGDWFKKWLK